MDSQSIIFLVLVIVSLILQGFFAMTEMAFVTFNRVRLAYFVEKGERGADSLRKLLNRPTALFGTTLIGVNFFLQFGSECGRRLYLSMGWNPDYAYVQQLILVLLFAELIPMLAARDHSEHLAMMVIKPVHILSKILAPFIFLIDGLSKILSYIIKSPLKVNTTLSRDELKNLLKDSEGSPAQSDKEDLEPLIENIFLLSGKMPKDIMIPIKDMHCISYHSVVGDVRAHFHEWKTKFVPLYHEKKENIFGIAYAQDLLNMTDDQPIKDIARSPWFVTSTNTIFQVINQFRKNNQRIAIVLDTNGNVIGVLSLSSIVDEIFTGILVKGDVLEERSKVYINKTFPVDTKVSFLIKDLHLALNDYKNATLEDVMKKKLGFSPRDEDRAYIEEYEFIYEGATFPKDRRIRVKSRG